MAKEDSSGPGVVWLLIGIMISIEVGASLLPDIMKPIDEITGETTAATQVIDEQQLASSSGLTLVSSPMGWVWVEAAISTGLLAAWYMLRRRKSDDINED